ncbi:hypothetical protein BDQ12DRAFT_679535 [Crucibulum laeve]|uniref:NAD(P)-binding protein n=1 Tax=Crucibulum laeve TaxID=68775 RepID=A0A5C3M9J9_9AGAR|nr:hypothetical protein BDQ12DRAFT_679535 [Crucibulum laeve]
MDENQNITDVSPDIIRRAFQPNFFGLVQTTTSLLPLLRKATHAVILNVSTDVASNTRQSRPETSYHLVAYNTSKAAANPYTVSLAHELRKEDIKVNAVIPGSPLPS